MTKKTKKPKTVGDAMDNHGFVSMKIAENGDLMFCEPTENEVREHNAIVKEITKHYGKERAGHANIGWASGDDWVQSKVYGDPCMVVTTTFKRRRGKMIKATHEHELYKSW